MEFTKFWNYYPKYVIAILFLLIVHFLLRGNMIGGDYSYFLNSIIVLGDFTVGVVIIIILIICIFFSVSALNIINYFFKKAIRRALFFIFRGKYKYPGLQLSSMEYSFHLLEENEKFLFSFHEIRTLTDTELFNKLDKTKKSLTKYHDDIKKFLKSIDNYELAYYLTYDAAYTQEQAKLNQYKSIVETWEFFFISVMILLFSFFSYFSFLEAVLLYLVTLSVCILLVYPLYRRARIRFAYFLIFLFMENFIVTDTTIEDREAY